MTAFSTWPQVRLTADDYEITAMQYREEMKACLSHRDMRGYHRAWEKARRFDKAARRKRWSDETRPRVETKEAA
jgi:hypothetical protein